MAEFGDFKVSDNNQDFSLFLDNDLLASLDFPFMASVVEPDEVDTILKLSEMDGLPSPGMPERFKSKTEQDLQMYEDSRETQNGELNFFKVHIPIQYVFQERERGRERERER